MKQRKAATTAAQGHPQPVPAEKENIPVGLMLLLFCIIVFSNPDTIHLLSLVLGVGTAITLFRKKALHGILTVSLLAVSAYVLYFGATTLFAEAGKFALAEYLKIFNGGCLFLLAVRYLKNESDPLQSRARTLAFAIAGAMALLSIISIDLASCHVLSAGMQWLTALFTTSFDVIPVETGVRMNSIFGAPNGFASMAGLGGLLSLPLVLQARDKRARIVALVLLECNALGFALVFSLGASAALLAGFFLFVLLMPKESRLAGSLLLIEVLAVSLLAAFFCFPQFDGTGSWLPMLIALLAIVAIILLDLLVNQKIAALLGQHRKATAASLMGLLGLLILFGAVALNLHGPAWLDENETLRRSLYLEGGDYAILQESSGDAMLRVISQNEQELIMHTETLLYNGDAAFAAFTVPDDSEVVYLFYSPFNEAVEISNAYWERSDGAQGEIKLEYTLLPGFMANRLQGLFANENLAQRYEFFRDAFAMFKESPVLGSGLGGYANGLPGVQSFFYETRYVHNHYIQVLSEGGVLGCLFFLGMLGAMGYSLIQRRKQQGNSVELAALFATLLFVLIHAGAEVIFSYEYYLPLIFLVFALMANGSRSFHWDHAIQNGIGYGIAACLCVYCLLLGSSLFGVSIAENATQNNFFRSMERAAKYDRFNRNDYYVSYINGLWSLDATPSQQEQAAEYAAELAEVRSNTSGPYVIQYYFGTGQPELGFAAAAKTLQNNRSDAEVWNAVLPMLKFYTEPSGYLQNPQVFIDGSQMIYQQWIDANESLYEVLPLDNNALDYLAQCIALRSLADPNSQEAFDLLQANDYLGYRLELDILMDQWRNQK